MTRLLIQTGSRSTVGFNGSAIMVVVAIVACFLSFSSSWLYWVPPISLKIPLNRASGEVRVRIVVIGSCLHKKIRLKFQLHLFYWSWYVYRTVIVVTNTIQPKYKIWGQSVVGSSNGIGPGPEEEFCIKAEHCDISITIKFRVLVSVSEVE